MKFLIVGIDYNLLDMDQRKYFYFSESDKLSFSTMLLRYNINQSVILSTCNRSEVYVICDDSFNQENLKDLFLSYFDQKNDAVQVMEGLEAIKYLLEVSCGLRSMIVGEDQILHQVKDAYNFALKNNFTGKEMNYIFQNVLNFSKNMKNKYAISENPLSICYLAYLELKQHLNDNSNIMICGGGEIAQLMITYLKNYKILLVNRSKKRVEHLLNDKICFIPFEERYKYINQVEVVISATSSPHLVFQSEYMNINKPTYFIDLAMPRDIDKSLKNNSFVKHIDMDDLKVISQNHLNARKEICNFIENECFNYSNKILCDLEKMKNDILIKKIQDEFMVVADDTFELLKNKLDLNSHQEYVLKKVLHASFSRLMQKPINLIKNDNNNINVDVISKMVEEEKEHKK